MWISKLVMHATITWVPLSKHTTITNDNFLYLIDIIRTNNTAYPKIICTSEYMWHVSIIKRNVLKNALKFLIVFFG